MGEKAREVVNHRLTKSDIKQQVNVDMQGKAEKLLEKPDLIASFNIKNLSQFTDSHSGKEYKKGEYREWNDQFLEGVLGLKKLNASDKRMRIMAVQIFINKNGANLEVDGKLGPQTLKGMCAYCALQRTTKTAPIIPRARAKIDRKNEKPISKTEPESKQFEIKNEEVEVVDSDMSREEAIRRNVHPDCPESIIKRQVVVDVKYYGFDGKVHKGQLVVDKDHAKNARQIFAVIFRTKFPVKSVIPISHPKYLKNGWNDGESMKDNNTSGFNYRAITGGKSLSKHANGFAFDINPKLNPYIRGKTVEPPGAKYDPKVPGTLTKDCAVVKELRKLGWSWGGAWKTKSGIKDYQHFQKAPNGAKYQSKIPRLKAGVWRSGRKSKFYNERFQTQEKFFVSSKRKETLEKKYPALHTEIKRILTIQGIYGTPKALAVVAKLFEDYHITGSYCGHFCKMVYRNAGLVGKWLRYKPYNSVTEKTDPKWQKNHYLAIATRWFEGKGKSSNEALQLAKKSLVDVLKPGVYFVVPTTVATTHGFGFVKWHDKKNMLAVVYGQPGKGRRSYSERIVNLGPRPIRVRTGGGKMKTISPHKVTRIYDINRPNAIMPSKSFVARVRKEDVNQAVA